MLLQVHHTVNFPEFHVDWMSPEEVYLHRENAPSQIYRGISASLGFKKPSGNRLFRGYKELCQHNGKPTDVAATTHPTPEIAYGMDGMCP